MSYSKLIYFVLLPTFILVSCDTTSTNEEDHDLFEIISTEVDSIESNAIYIKTDFRLTEEYEFEETKISYELYISTEDQPDESNSVSFTDVTGEEGLLEYDEQENQGTLINVIQGLELETEYNYRIKIIINDQQKWAEVSNFRTKDVVEILSTEVRSLKTRSVRLYTIFKINKTWKYNSHVDYEIFLSTDENPSDSNSVDFFDDTDMTGLVYYDEDEEKGISSNVILDLLPSTTYYYRVKITFEDYEQLTDVIAFTTKEESYEETGGIEFYDKGEYSDGWRYLVATPPGWYDGSKYDPVAVWGCYDKFVGATNNGLGFGLSNTQKIIEQNCTSAEDQIIATDLAFNLELNGFDDWYLPSSEEMYLLVNFENAAIYSALYWTSTEADSIFAVTIDSWGLWDSELKNEQLHVRPIRRY